MSKDQIIAYMKLHLQTIQRHKRICLFLTIASVIAAFTIVAVGSSLTFLVVLLLSWACLFFGFYGGIHVTQSHFKHTPELFSIDNVNKEAQD